MVFEDVHEETRGGHLHATPRKYFAGSATTNVFSFVPLLTWIAAWIQRQMTWIARFLTCHSLVLTWRVHYVVMCGFANVVCDTKMSHETSSSTEAFIFEFFWGDALFSWTVFVTVGCFL